MHPNLLHMARHIRHGFGDLSTAATTSANALKDKFNAFSRQLKSLGHKSKSVPAEVELCLLICSLFPDDSRIPVDDLVMYLMGLKLVEDVSDIFAARCRAMELISIINGLKYTRKVVGGKVKLTHEKYGPYDQCVKMLVGARELMKLMPLSCPLEFSLQTIKEEWPQINSYKDVYGLSLVLKRVKNHPVYLACPKLALLQLQYREDSKIIPIDFFEDMNKLRALSLDVPSLPQSLCFPRNLTTLRIKIIELEDMSWIGALTSLEFLSISTSSLTDIPREMGNLEKLRFLDLKNVNLAHIPPGIFSRMLKLEELYMPLSFGRWGCNAKRLHDYEEWEIGEEDDEEKINSITGEINHSEKINASLSEIVSPSLHALHLSIPKGCVLPKMSSIYKNIRQFKVHVPNYIKYQLVDVDSSNELQLTGDACDIKESGMCDLMSTAVALSLMRVKNLKNVTYFLEKNVNLLLKKMIISECEELECVVDVTKKDLMSKGSYTPWKLESLHLSMLYNLDAICHDIWQTYRWFSNLRRLSIRFCPKLRFVFSTSLLKSRILLKDIEILDCKRMKGVFYEDEEVNAPGMLGCVENIDLHSLPYLDGFSMPKNSGYDGLLPSWITNEAPLIMGRMFSSKFAAGLKNLRRLKIGFCDSIAIIFLFKENDGTSKAFFSLKELELFGMRNLVHIWCQIPRKTSAFQNLQYLAVSECSNAYPFSFLVAKLLVQLQKVCVSRCERIIEIIANDADERKGGVVLPRLKLLEVQHTPNLVTLFGGGYEIELPSLESLKLNQCDMVKSLSNGLLKMPMLEGIDVNGSFHLLTKDHNAIFTGVRTLHSFKLADLKIATKKFSSDNLVGEGGFAQVYKGWIDRKTYAPSKTSTGMPVAVKRYKTHNYKNAKEKWTAEVDILPKKLHPNLIKLLGHCSEDGELLLVYEMMPRGSLYDHLFARGSGIEPLLWDTRIKIAIGVAGGLNFLHTFTPQVVHRNIKPSNILLNTDYSSRIADFGLAILGPSDGGSHDTTMNYNANISDGGNTRLNPWDSSYLSSVSEGTTGYLDPGYFTSGRVTEKSDVYSFGVLLLQLMTGLKANDWEIPNQRNLVARLKPTLRHERELKDMMDSTMDGQYSSKSMLLMAKIASRCLESDHERRPPMGQVLEELHRVLNAARMSTT